MTSVLVPEHLFCRTVVAHREATRKLWRIPQAPADMFAAIKARKEAQRATALARVRNRP